MDYNKAEKRQAKKDGAQVVPNSGRGFLKGDATWHNFLIDYKFNAKSFTLNIENWLKLKKDAWNSSQRNPAIVVKFEDGTSCVILDWELFKDIYGNH